MKFSKTVDFSYQSYLHSIRHRSNESDKVQVKDLLSDYQTYNDYFTETVPLFFIIDYVKQQYLFVSESCKQVLGYDAWHLLKDGLALTNSSMHTDFWLVYDRKIFQAVSRVLTSSTINEHQDLTFSFNAHFKRADGKWINLLQNTKYICSPATRLPLYCLAMVTDITSFKTDNFMNYKVEKTDRQTGQIKQLDHKKFYVCDEDKLLTSKEKLVLKHIADGLSSKMIAGKLNISENTINNHRQNMFTKTETYNTAQLVAFSIRSGII